jgi:hypothetical protein
MEDIVVRKIGDVDPRARPGLSDSQAAFSVVRVSSSGRSISASTSSRAPTPSRWWTR